MQQQRYLPHGRASNVSVDTCLVVLVLAQDQQPLEHGLRVHGEVLLELERVLRQQVQGSCKHKREGRCE